MKPNFCTYICADEICKKTFASLNSLKKHVAVCHVDNAADEKDRNFKCDFDGCEKEFSRQKQLYDHKYNSHKTGKVYECNSCSLTFPTPSKLKRHTKQHTGYPCSITGCLILSKTVRDRQKHFLECHQNKIDFVCEKCSNKSFVNAKSLRRHQKSHQNLIKCDQIGCTEEFLPMFLKRHLKTCHFDKIPPDGRRNGDVLPYVCDECQKTFAKSEHLKKHVNRSHLDLDNNRRRTNKFVCPSISCGRSFVSRVKYESHVNWHNNEKPFKCPINNCLNCFSGKLSLQRHLRQIHLTTLQSISAINEFDGAAIVSETVLDQPSIMSENVSAQSSTVV